MAYKMVTLNVLAGNILDYNIIGIELLISKESAYSLEAVK